MADVPEIQKMVKKMLHEIHEVQRDLSEMAVPVKAKHLNPKRRAMDCLARAQHELEGAEITLLHLEESLVDAGN